MKRRDWRIAGWRAFFSGALLSLATAISAAESTPPQARPKSSGSNLPVYAWDGCHRYLLFINSASDRVIVLVSAPSKEHQTGYFVSETAMQMIRSMAPATLQEFDFSTTPTIIDGHHFYLVAKKGRHVPL